MRQAKKSLKYFFNCIFFLIYNVCNSQDIKGRLVIHEFHSEVFRNSRQLRVFLPPGYDKVENKKKNYLVLYLNDGQNLFDSNTSTSNRFEWRVDEVLDSLWNKKAVKEFIVVGIDNIGRRDRGKEYLAYQDEYLSPPIPNPEGKKYPEFLCNEVIPFIDSVYRTIPNAAGRALGGSSYGAIAALYAILNIPKKFGYLLLESPSLYVDNKHLIKDAEQTHNWPKKIYVGVGTNEMGRANCIPGDLNEEAVRDVLTFSDLLKKKGFIKTSLKVIVDDCATHTEEAWSKRLPIALKFLFGRE